MQFLKQSTEVDVRVGPAMDPTDGVTPVTGLTLGAADQAELLKHDGAATVDISGRTFAAITDADGWYDLTLTTTDTNTLGLATVVIQDASASLPIFLDFMVMPAALYDGMYGSGIPELTGVPSATPDLATAAMLPYQKDRNARITDSATGEDRISNDAGSVILEQDFTDAANVLTKSKVRVP